MAGEKSATRLRELRASGQTIAGLSDDLRPQTLAQAYEIQGALVTQRLDQEGGELIGWKVGATNTVAQAQVGSKDPFYGRMLSSRVFESGDDVPIGNRRVGIEPEFTYELAEDVPSAESPWTADTVASFIASVRPSIELVWAPFDDWVAAGALSLVAGNAAHDSWVRGPASAAGTELAGIEVEPSLNGKPLAIGGAAAVLGHPLNVLAWLANALQEHGEQLRAGDVITTGVCTELFFGVSGDRIDVDFGRLGMVAAGLAS